jgi:hypothetical protein
MVPPKEVPPLTDYVPGGVTLPERDGKSNNARTFSTEMNKQVSSVGSYSTPA